MKKMVLVVAALACVIYATAGWGQGGPRGPGGPWMASPAMAVMPPRADMIDGITKALSLTEDQAASLKAILTRSDTDLAPLVQTAAEKCKALRAGVCDSANVATLLAEAESAEAALIARCILTWSQISSSDILTADQLAKLQAGPPRGPAGFPPPPPPE